MMPITKYRSFDGMEFDDKLECLAYEKRNAHLRLVGLSAEQVEAVLLGNDADLADAIEVVGARLARARLAAGHLKRAPNERAPRQLTYQLQDENPDDDDTLESHVDKVIAGMGGVA